MASETLDVVIIGAGLSGIGGACHLLRKTSNKRFAILESRASMGGTWDLFRYPGIRSDSDMHTLGYSFKPWKHDKAIADGSAILDYIRETAHQYDIGKFIRYNHQVIQADWDSNAALWSISVKQGDASEVTILRCRYIFACTGYYRYDQGYTPEFSELEKFNGNLVHPQHWPEDLDWSGKRIIVIGSGATAITLVPSLAKTAAHVTMLQRSPTYVVSRTSVDRFAKRLDRYLPDKLAYWITRWKNVFSSMLMYQYAKRRPDKMRKSLLQWTRRWLGDSCDVDTHFSPTYKPWDQRLCLVPDGNLFRSLREGSSSIVTDHISHFTEEGIALKSGQHLTADIVVTATGLELLPVGGICMTVDGKSVDFADSTQYKGMMLSDVPNFFSATGYTNASWTLKCDLTSEYVCRIISHMDSNNQQICIPRNKNCELKRTVSIGLTSGYILRSIDKFPKEGTFAPWKLHQNYFLDLLGLRFGRIKDRYLEFMSLAEVSQEKVVQKPE